MFDFVAQHCTRPHAHPTWPVTAPTNAFERVLDKLGLQHVGDKPSEYVEVNGHCWRVFGERAEAIIDGKRVEAYYRTPRESQPIMKYLLWIDGSLEDAGPPEPRTSPPPPSAEANSLMHEAMAAIEF